MGSSLQVHYKNEHPLDEDLTCWNEFLAGNTGAYESLYHKYVNELYRYAYVVVKDKSLAEDVIHDVFTTIWSSKDRLGKIRSVRLYLFSSVKRRALRKLKKERTFAFFNQEEEDGSFEITTSFLDELIDSQNKDSIEKKLKKSISALSNRQREIIYLRFYQNMTYSEIAELLELDQKYTYNLASKAFVALRKTIPRFAFLPFSLALSNL